MWSFPLIKKKNKNQNQQTKPNKTKPEQNNKKEKKKRCYTSMLSSTLTFQVTTLLHKMQQNTALS